MEDNKQMTIVYNYINSSIVLKISLQVFVEAYIKIIMWAYRFCKICYFATPIIAHVHAFNYNVIERHIKTLKECSITVLATNYTFCALMHLWKLHSLHAPSHVNFCC